MDESKLAHRKPCNHLGAKGYLDDWCSWRRKCSLVQTQNLLRKAQEYLEFRTLYGRHCWAITALFVPVKSIYYKTRLVAMTTPQWSPWKEMQWGHRSGGDDHSLCVGGTMCCPIVLLVWPGRTSWAFSFFSPKITLVLSHRQVQPNHTRFAQPLSSWVHADAGLHAHGCKAQPFLALAQLEASRCCGGFIVMPS